MEEIKIHTAGDSSVLIEFGTGDLPGDQCKNYGLRPSDEVPNMLKESKI